MALVLANAARLKPEVALTQALHEYKAILTDEQKKVLQSHHGHPDASAVITLTVDIDRENSDRRSRCVGTRLITFLESVQQFTSIVDTFVSSSPNIAALVWGGVKLALLAANNFTSFFDKLSTLFMSIGSTCPRFTEFGLLYPSSIGLQKALCDYYAVIIQLCKKVTEFSGKPGLSQFTTTFLSPFEAQFGKFAKDLENLGQAVRDGISLASKQVQLEEARLQEIERQEASRFRSLGTKFRGKASQEQKEAREWRLQAESRNIRYKKLQILNALSMYNHMTAWKKARKKCLMGTSTWISARSEFETWMSSPGPSSLWCTGTLGAGKTVLSAEVAAHLTKTVSPVDSVGFFFCRYDESESIRARTIVGSIARQLLHDLPLESFSKVDQVSEALSLDTDQILDLLQEVLPINKRHFVIIDGLDECGEEEAKELILAIRKLLASQRITFKLFCSSRPDVFRWVPTILNPEWHVSMAVDDVNPDIEHYIDATLQQRIESGELQLGDPTLILTVRDALLSGAQGMFLWVAFQVETICAQRSDQGITKTLHSLPKDLPETFDRILGRLAKMEDMDRDNSLQIFKWIAVAKRPLTLAELREVIGIKPCQQSLKVECLINNMPQALACCGSLVEIEEEHSTVHFTHHSVKQYLLSAARDPTLERYHFDPEEADTEAGEICVTYLSFPELTMQVARASTSRPHVQIYPSSILKETLPHTGLTSRVALKLLKTRPNTNYSFHRHLEESIGIPEAQHLQQAQCHFAFLDYAQTHWLSHTSAFTEGTKTWDRWSDLVRKDLSIAYGLWVKFKSGIYGKYDMQEIVREDHRALLLLKIKSFYSSQGYDFEYHSVLLEKNSVSSHNLVQDYDRRWFYDSVNRMILEKRYGLLRILLYNSDYEIGHTIIFLLRNEINAVLAGLGNLELLEEQQARMEELALVTVSCDGLLRYSILRLLKRRLNPEVNLALPATAVFDPENCHWSALAVAASLGHTHVVEFILKVNKSSGALARTIVPSFNEIFMQAAVRNQIEVLHLLLDHGAEYVKLDERDSRGFTPLMYTAALGNVDLAEKLIRMGPRLNIKDHSGETALSKARNRDMVKVLTRAGATVKDYQYVLD